MPPVVDPNPSEARTPTDVIGSVRAARQALEAAERNVWRVAKVWAESHEVFGPQRAHVAGDFPDGSHLDDVMAEWDSQVDAEEVQDRSQWRGLPELTWDCFAPFAAALGLTTRGGRTVLRRTLIMVHRMPQTHAWWEDGKVSSRVVRQVADAVVGQPDDVCAWVDAMVADRLLHHRTVGPVVLDRLVDKALLELHAEEQELIREEQLQARYARVDTPGNRPDVHGLAEFIIRGDWADITAFNTTIAALADAIRRSDRPDAAEPLDVRRSIAVGILADPAAALALLSPPVDDGHAGAQPRPGRKQQVLISFHLAADAVGGVGGGLRVRRDGAVVDTEGRPWLGAAVTEWIGRPDTTVTIRPVVHCGGCAECETHCDRHADPDSRHSYRPTDLDRERVALRDPHCVFPYCTTPARQSDCDHIVAFRPEDPGGTPTCPRCNLAPLCRHHHRLKTHAGWSYRQLEPGAYTWTEPHGQRFVTTRWGTTDVTDSTPGSTPDRTD